MRVLIAYEESHRVYRDALERAIVGLRPRVQVRTSSLRELQVEVIGFDPHLVVSSRPNTVDPGGRAAWYTLSHEPDDPSEMCVGGRRSESENPGLEELLAVIDEAEDLVGSGRAVGGC